ncbi:hypothetical protein Tco_0562969, partial [Tanacetum coccineum]
SNGNSLPTASDNISTDDPTKSSSTPAVETLVPTDSPTIPTVIKSRGRGFKYTQPPSIINVVASQNSPKDFFRDASQAPSLTEVEADLSNMKTGIQV